MKADAVFLVRAAQWHIARRNYVASLLWAFWIMPYFGAPTLPRADLVLDVLVLPLACGLTLRNLNEFLPDLRLWSRGQRAAAWALALLLSASNAARYWLPDAGLAPVMIGAIGLALTGEVVAFLVALTRVYRHAAPLGRRQIKWVVYGFYVALLPAALVGAVFSLGVVPEWTGALFNVSAFALVAIPLGFLVAVAFYEFLDIDRLFSAALSYSVLAILGLAIVLGVMRPPTEPDARARRGGGHRRHDLSPRRPGDVRQVRAPCGSGHSRPRQARDRARPAAVIGPHHPGSPKVDMRGLQGAQALR